MTAGLTAHSSMRPPLAATALVPTAAVAPAALTERTAVSSMQSLDGGDELVGTSPLRPQTLVARPTGGDANVVGPCGDGVCGAAAGARSGEVAGDVTGRIAVTTLKRPADCDSGGEQQPSNKRPSL